MHLQVPTFAVFGLYLLIRTASLLLGLLYVVVSRMRGRRHTGLLYL